MPEAPSLNGKGVDTLSETEARTLAVEGASKAVQRRANGQGIQTSRPPGNGSAFPEFTMGGQLAGVFQSYAPLGYLLPWQTLDYIELLSTYNPDFSQAVDNIRTLANSGHNLFVKAGSELQTRRTHDFLDDKARVINERGGGIDGLIDQLLDQAAVYGAMCGEWVTDDSLTDVVSFTVVNPKHVRFFWDNDADDWMPYQKVNVIQQEEAEKRGQKVKTGCVELNPLTFHYYNFDSQPGSPYGTPPFLAALANIAIQRDMINNMSQIVKKVGLLGIIDLVIKSLPPKPGENDDAYQARAGAYLQSYVGVVEEMVRDGGIIHFDDVEASTYNITGNAAGATNIFKQNEELIFSGLKSMPSVQGRSYSTTETYAGVAYDIIIRNTHKYQRAVKRMIESGYWLMASLAGYTPSAIEVQFLPNKSLHRLQDAQAQRLEIFNSILLWAMGFINQTQAAQQLGYQSPETAYETPPESPLLGPPPTVGISAKGADDEGGATAAQPAKNVTLEISEDQVGEMVERVVSEIAGCNG